ncbi:hypothetical protein GFL91_29075 [Rhizobium leguminosarum bv. viciae]|uniref:Uncharacterized protein n=4 Tax=Rhizobium TaxID=379 RepID=A0A8I2KIE1_RHILV|nr:MULTISPECIES: hypothetical protein [Rhizobium]MBA1346166.1 hypothetical protein [Rhizobium sp. WYCCWR 11146]MBX4863592.1 hypothetical protein [Rhizobium bangladeshense]MBX4905102.1 hypothetical protein [Rhizobium bangladeshense]MBX4927172.1 hypothetical protein [Rhizobium binae]MBX5132430.1 hypothetical protein [Rhizobium lentis]
MLAVQPKRLRREIWKDFFVTLNRMLTWAEWIVTPQFYSGIAYPLLDFSCRSRASLLATLLVEFQRLPITTGSQASLLMICAIIKRPQVLHSKLFDLPARLGGFSTHTGGRYSLNSNWTIISPQSIRRSVFIECGVFSDLSIFA